MPIGKKQSNTSTVALIIFVFLFVVALIAAIACYMKFEEYRTKATELQSQTDELAKPAELRKIGALVGEKQRTQSRLGTMLDYMDQMTVLAIGGEPEDTSAEVKLETAKRQSKEFLALLAKDYTDYEGLDAEKVGLIRTLEKLKTTADNLRDVAVTTQQQLQELQKRFDEAAAANFDKEQTLLAEKEQYKQQVDTVQKDYSDLKALLEKSTEDQVQTLIAQMEEERETSRELNQRMLRTEAELKIAHKRMQRAQEKLQGIVSPPDMEVAAYKPDGKVLLIDDPTKIVHINLGSDDRVYRGLTFSIYDKNMPIPKDGRGKGEIEVFNVGENISAARIIRSETRNPIILDDIVANLIWDAEQVNTFVVAGDFDLNDDGNTDDDAVEKITALIQKWGGRAARNISVDTDFVILGKPPQVLRKPTFEQMEIDPMAMQKYERSLYNLEHYKETRDQAQTLSIPIFNAERFLYFIGYKTQATQPGAF
ncbi:MAG: BRCT domain-containing protein [Planctomycetota bacterium]|jgi:hypothetical protein